MNIQTKARRAGFFSDCVWLLSRVINAYRSCYKKKSPMNLHVDTANMFTMYKTKYETDNNVDLYPLYFNYNDDISIDMSNAIPSLRPESIIYKADFTGKKHLLDNNTFKSIMQKHFFPSDNVLRVVEDIVNKYNIDVRESCYVYYRGTDKLNKESKDVSLQDYIHSISNKQFDQIIVQTDDINFYNEIKRQFESAIVFDETWTGVNNKSVNKAIHRDMFGTETAKDNILALLASVYIASQCKYLVSNTSNVSLFIQLYRAAIFGNLSSLTDNILYTRDPALLEKECKHLPQFQND